MVQVPGGEEDPGLVALVRVDGVVTAVLAVLLIIPSLAAEQTSKEWLLLVVDGPEISYLHSSHLSLQILSPSSAPRSKYEPWKSFCFRLDFRISTILTAEDFSVLDKVLNSLEGNFKMLPVIKVYIYS